MDPNTMTLEEQKKIEMDHAPQEDDDGEEFQITVKKLDLPVKPRGVLAE
jgi:hypothetical protein